MAALRLKLYAEPTAELEQLTGATVPTWVERLYGSYGTTAAAAPLSAVLEAAAEEFHHRLRAVAALVRKVEARGWRARLDGDTVLVVSGLAAAETQALLEADGVWILARQYAFKREDSEVEWM